MVSFAYHVRRLSVGETFIGFVILALAMITFMAAKDISNTAKLRDVVQESQKYIQHVHNFTKLYAGLPGDLPNATNYWPETTNGNNNGFIDNKRKEKYTAWQQLGLTKLIAETFNGTSQMPETSLNNGTYYHLEKNPYRLYEIPAHSINALHIRYRHKWHDAISPRFAKLLDIKMDDGIASSGKIIGFSDNSNDCAKSAKTGKNVGNDYSDIAYYNTTQRNLRCILTFKLPDIKITSK